MAEFFTRISPPYAMRFLNLPLLKPKFLIVPWAGHNVGIPTTTLILYILWPSGNLVFDFSRIGIAARQWKITFRAYLAVIEQINSENGTIDGFIGILTDCYCDFTLFYCK